MAYTFNLKKKYPALDTRNSWGFLESVDAVSDTKVVVSFNRVYVPGFGAIAEQIIIPKHIFCALFLKIESIMNKWTRTLSRN